MLPYNFFERVIYEIDLKNTFPDDFSPPIVLYEPELSGSFYFTILHHWNQSLTQLNTDLNGIKSSLLVRSINPTNISNFNEFNVTLEKVGNIVTCQYAISNPYAFGDIDLFQIPSGYAPRGTCYAWTNRRTSTQESCRNQIYISPTNIKFQNNDGSTALESWGEFTYTIAI